MNIRTSCHRRAAMQTRRICSWSLIGALAAVPLSAQAPDSVAPLRIDRDGAIKEALAHNPTLAVAREQIAQARARVTQGYALPEPSISATVLGATGFAHPHTGERDRPRCRDHDSHFRSKIILRGAGREGRPRQLR